MGDVNAIKNAPLTQSNLFRCSTLQATFTVSLLLLDWQYQVIWDVYGTVKDDGYRQYQYVVEIPKKNGKTEMVAGLGLYHLINDPPSGQIYCCAAEREQASLVYRAAKQMIEQDPALQEMVRVVDSKKEIHNKHTSTFMKVLSAEVYSKHGLNPTVVIFDELHAQPNRDLWDVMTFGAGAARKEPLWWVITTAGDDPDRHSIGWEVHEYARRLIDGEIADPIWYAKIYCADDDDNIFDEAVWHKANPSLGHTIEIEKCGRKRSAPGTIRARKGCSGGCGLINGLRLKQLVGCR